MQDNSVHMPQLQSFNLFVVVATVVVVVAADTNSANLAAWVPASREAAWGPLWELLSLARMQKHQQQQLLTTRTIRIRRVHPTSNTQSLALLPSSSASLCPGVNANRQQLNCWQEASQAARQLPHSITSRMTMKSWSGEEGEYFRLAACSINKLPLGLGAGNSCFSSCCSEARHNVGAILLFAFPLVIKWHPACCFLWRQRRQWWSW